jgi:hypothetical protein
MCLSEWNWLYSELPEKSNPEIESESQLSTQETESSQLRDSSPPGKS